MGDEHANHVTDQAVDQAVDQADAAMGKRYEKRHWQELVSLETAEDYNRFFAENQNWKKTGSRFDITGEKTRYYCNMVKKIRGQAGCPAELMVHSMAGNEKKVVFINGKEHVHAEDNPRTVPVAMAVKTKIQGMVSRKLTPGLIYVELQKDNDVQNKPTANQVFYRLL